MPRRIDFSAAHLSAMQTAALTCVGGLIAAGGFLAEFPASAHKHVHHGDFWPWVLTTFTLVVGGFAIMLLAGSDLQNGIAAERWPGAEISRLRDLLKSRASTGLVIAFMVALVVTLVVSLFAQRYRALFWAFYALNQTLFQLRNMTREPSSKIAQPTWTNLAPLQSQHWGQR